MKADELREECQKRNMNPEGLNRDQNIVYISQYEGKVQKEEPFDHGDLAQANPEEIALGKLELQLKLQEQERKDRESARDHEYRMKQLQMQEQNIKSVSEESVPVIESRSLKMPFLKDDDDIETYLCTFERIATTNKWNEMSWVTRLAPLLTGKAREAYIRMNILDSGNYEQLKKAILAGYDLTPDRYRKLV